MGFRFPSVCSKSLKLPRVLNNDILYLVALLKWKLLFDHLDLTGMTWNHVPLQYNVTSINHNENEELVLNFLLRLLLLLFFSNLYTVGFGLITQHSSAACSFSWLSQPGAPWISDIRFHSTWTLMFLKSFCSCSNFIYSLKNELANTLFLSSASFGDRFCSLVSRNTKSDQWTSFLLWNDGL